MRSSIVLASVAAILAALPAAAQQSDQQALAKQLSNPVAALISVPFQLNYDSGFGTTDADRWLLNFQPVIPFSISDNWNVISRTIIPFTSLGGLTPGASTTTGIGTTTQSFFFSPKKPTAGGLIWGVGPAFGLPATDETLGPDVWSAGVTGVALKQTGRWTVGMLGNQLWSVSGGGDPGDEVNSMYLQPFVSYTTPTAVSFGLNSEATYNWNAEQWTASVNATVGKVTKLGKLPVQFTGGLRYWIDSPEPGPDGFGARFVMTFLFPKGKG
jgi:hypothetical protein